MHHPPACGLTQPEQGAVTKQPIRGSETDKQSHLQTVCSLQSNHSDLCEETGIPGVNPRTQTATGRHTLIPLKWEILQNLSGYLTALSLTVSRLMPVALLQHLTSVSRLSVRAESPETELTSYYMSTSLVPHVLSSSHHNGQKIQTCAGCSGCRMTGDGHISYCISTSD